MTTQAAPPAPEPVLDGLPRRVRPSTPLHLALRVVLLVLLAASVASAAQQPAQRTADDLRLALDRGEVDTLTIERPAGEVSGALRLHWTGDGRDAVATYRVESSGPDGSLYGVIGPDDDVLDEGLTILAVAADAPGDVEVREVDRLPAPSTWTSGLPITTVVLGTLAAGLTLLVLMLFGPEPALATRWAWVWVLLYAWPAALAYVVLEPTPFWSRRTVDAPARRLTGGWALVVAIVAGPPLTRALTGA